MVRGGKEHKGDTAWAFISGNGSGAKKKTALDADEQTRRYFELAGAPPRGETHGVARKETRELRNQKMAEYDNTNRGVLFKNDRKEKDTHADYQGSLNVEGVEYWLNAWVKEGKNGKFFSVSIREKQARTDTQKPAQGKAFDEGYDDEIPF